MSINTEDFSRFKNFISDRLVDNTNEKWGIQTNLFCANLIKKVANERNIPVILITTKEISKIKEEIVNNNISVLFITTKWVQIANTLQWECPSFHTYICIGAENPYTIEEVKLNRLMNSSFWDIIYRRAKNDISAGGWFNSYTGEPFSQIEMNEYIINTNEKLASYLSNECDVLEIGCASGLTMFALAPLAHTYTGIDMSEKMINKNQQIIDEQKLTNVHVFCLKADEIDKFYPNKYNIIILNSVCQYFHGFNYFRNVLKKIISLLPERGLVFIGDIMDLDQKVKLITSLKSFEKNNLNSKFETKTVFDNELFIPRDFFYDFQIECDGDIEEVIISDKIGNIRNELRDFRYDVILKINKVGNKKLDLGLKQKKQYGFIL